MEFLTSVRCWLLSLSFTSLFLPAFPQAGSLDPNFDPGAGANGAVKLIAVQPDGKIVLAGAFIAFNIVPAGHIVRLHTDGSVDSTFQCGSGFDAEPLDMEVQGDGKLLICGGFTVYNGTALTRRLTRLNVDGTMDTSFNPPSFGPISINSIELRSDGRILLGGGMGVVSPMQSGVCQLNPDGTPDPLFSTGTGFNSFVSSIELLSDGSIMVTGLFTSFAGTSCPGFCVLNASGSLKTSFQFGSGFNVRPNCMEASVDGGCFIGGGFTTYRGNAVKRLLKLNSDGTPDTTFNVGTGPSANVNSVHLQSDGRLLCGGALSSFNGTAVNRLCRLEANGAINTTFNTGTGANGLVLQIGQDGSGALIVSGNFTQFNGQSRVRVARLFNCAAQTWYTDGDGDGLGSISAPVPACAQPTGTAANSNDCDDTDAGIGGPRTFFADVDGDGDGNPAAPLTACFPPSGYVQSNTDCNDADPELYPFALCHDGDALTYGDEVGEDRLCRGRHIQVQVTCFLAGPYNGTDMNADLLQMNMIPLQEPYTALGYTFVGGGGEATTPSVLDPAGTFFDVVDWVVLEIRHPTTPVMVLASQACLLRRNGSVTAVAGVDAPQFVLPIGPYHIAIRHRNHLGVMTAAALEVDSIVGALVSFQLPATPTYGANARQIVDGAACLWPGDVQGDGYIMYTGMGNDRDLILQRIGGTLPTATAFGYYQEDVNLDGAVRYTGGDNDRDPILEVIGGSVPTAVRHHGLP